MTHPPTRTAARTLAQSCMSYLFVALYSLTESEILGDACVDGEVRAILRRAHADTRSVAQLIDAVERVDDHQPCVELPDQRLIEVLYHAEIDLRIERQLVGVRKAATQTASHQSVERERRSAEIVGSTE